MRFTIIFILIYTLSQGQNKTCYSEDHSYEIHYMETTSFFDGSKIKDYHVDDVVYKKKGVKYYVLADFKKGRSINAKTFGVVADGVTDDTKSLQSALNAASKFGFTLILPYGTMITSGDLILDLSKSRNGFTLRGSGVANTVIKNIGNSTKNALLITGSYFNNLDVRDFRIERDLASPVPTGENGLVIEKQVYASLENIEVIRFMKGVVMKDVSSAYLKGVNARFCSKGFYFHRGENGVSNPNLIALHSCVLTSNDEWGVTIVNGHSVNIQSSLFESNLQGGINFSFDATNGGNSINLSGSYFEGNKGVDVFLKASAAGSHNFIGNTFNRVDDKQYTNHNIFMDLNTINTLSSTHMVNLIGNSFFVANNYKSSPLRKAVSIISDNLEKVIIHDTSFYKDILDKPDYPAIHLLK